MFIVGLLGVPHTGFLGLLSGDTMSAFMTADIMDSQKLSTSASCMNMPALHALVEVPKWLQQIFGITYRLARPHPFPLQNPWRKAAQPDSRVTVRKSLENW